MAVVHRFVPVCNRFAFAVLSYETEGHREKLPSTQELVCHYLRTREMLKCTPCDVRRKDIPASKPLWARPRRLETLADKYLAQQCRYNNMSARVKEHQLSPQGSDVEKYVNPKSDYFWDSFKSHRTNDKGGWIRRCLGQKPKNKDKRLRREGSSLTRAVNATF